MVRGCPSIKFEPDASKLKGGKAGRIQWRRRLTQTLGETENSNMLVFIYTVLILCIGVVNKLLQSYSGEYSAGELFTDLPLIIFTYFGLIAPWGRAKRRCYFSESFWRVYFLALMASLIIIPVFNQTIRALMHEFGVLTAIVAYVVMVVVIIPYYWALYSYAYGKDRVWAFT